MRFDVISLFPDIIRGYFREGILAQGIKKGLLEVNVHDLREFGKGNYRQVDERVFGGGAGMVLMFEPMQKAIEAVKAEQREQGITDNPVVAMTAKGDTFKQSLAKELQKKHNSMILVAGRYEGFDQRILDHLVDQEISLGNFVLTGGELPALAVIDAVARLVPGVLGKEESFQTDSFYEDDGIKQGPQYTRPEVIEYDGKKLKVPPILLSGHHENIEKWRTQNRVRKSD